MSIGNGNGHASGQDGNGAAAGPAPSLGESLNESFGEAQGFVKQQWQERPLVLAGVVAAAGLLLGLALRRR